MRHEAPGLWEKTDIILKPMGGLLTALAVAGVGFFGTQYLEQRQSAETNVRLYAELMSRREEADTSLRQGMFETIINKFLAADLSDPKQSVLAVELLAYNFHDALDLAPLFKDVNRNLMEENLPPYVSRLRRVAREVNAKQLAALSDVGALKTGQVRFPIEGEARRRPEKTDQDDYAIIRHHRARLDSSFEEKESTARIFQLDAVRVNVDTREVQVRLQVWPSEDAPTEFDEIFWVGFFDFPMIDNTRLNNGQRCAVVLTQFGDDSADLSLIYFPGSRASLKEKPYYDEVIENLVRTRRLLEEKAGG